MGRISSKLDKKKSLHDKIQMKIRRNIVKNLSFQSHSTPFSIDCWFTNLAAASINAQIVFVSIN